jgi:hypothetical protein
MNWTAKSPAEVVERRWTPPILDGDSIASVVAVGTGITVDSDDYDGNDAVVVLSGGTAGAEATVALTVTTTEGLVFAATFYIAVRAGAAALGYTASDICAFALAKIAGDGETSTASQSAVALERLNDMLAMWRIDGLDIGVAGVLALASTIDVPDEYVPAIKWNLRLLCHEHYGVLIDAFDVSMAERSRALVANSLLDIPDLAFDRTITLNGRYF